MNRFALWLFLICPLLAAQAPEQWTLELSMKVQSLGGVLPSPDGRLAVWTQTRAVMEAEKSEQLTHVFLGAADGSREVQLTRGDKSANSPAFSPDGRHVFFVSPRSGKPNIYRIPVDGGEAEQITDWKGDLGSYRLSPDGKWIAFLALEPDLAEEKAKRERNDFRVIDQNPKNRSLWIVSADPATAREKPPRKLFVAACHAGAFDWSPDSRRIAFEHRPAPDADLAHLADISEVEVESGQVRVLAGTEPAETDPLYSPDGRWIAFLRATGTTRLDGERIVLLDRSGGALRELPATFDENPNLIGWSGDSTRLFFSEGRRTRGALYAMPLNGAPAVVYQPDAGTVSPGARLNSTGTRIGLVRQSPTEPPEAFVADLATGKPVQVSRANASLPKLPLGETRVLTWKAGDGWEIEGLLTLPAGYRPGQKVPLILNIHGGPAGVYTESFIGSPSPYPIASFAAKGHAVLRANIRGSSAYGLPFRTAVKNDWGGKDYQDLMAGIDHVIAMGVADPDRLAVMGWSYGGYMTAWVVTQTQRFKAAAVGAGITNLVSMWGTNDIPSALDAYFSGTHWDQTEAYLRRSPMSHVSAVTTPTLILHGALDPRVPTTQGHEFYNALKRRGVKTEMVTYPRTQHGANEPKFVLDLMRRHLDWVEKHLP